MTLFFVELLKRILHSNHVQNDEFIDRLNNRYTVLILVLFCILVGSAQYVGHPISCWMPGEFTTTMVQYANYVCWIANTYYVPSSTYLPNPNQPRHFIAYYQWVPFILSLMAFLFYLPSILWDLMLKNSNLDPQSIMKLVLSDNFTYTNSETHEKAIKNIAKLIDRSLNYQYKSNYSYRQGEKKSFMSRLKYKLMQLCLPRYQSGRYLTILYIFIKLLYCVNVCGQFFFLNLFMGVDYNIYGYQVIRDLINGLNFWESPRFPRLTICDFTVRSLGNNNNLITIQCTLPINLFNEKIFIFIWFWLCLVASMTIYSLLTWLLSFTKSARNSFIKRYFNFNKINQNNRNFLHNFTLSNSNNFLINNNNSFDNRSNSGLNSITNLNLNVYRNKTLFKLFIFDYLKCDGILLLRLIRKNTNDIVVGELIHILWTNHYNK